MMENEGEYPPPLPEVELVFGSLKQKIRCQCDQPTLQIFGFIEKNLALEFESLVPVAVGNDSGEDFLQSVALAMVDKSLDAFVYGNGDMILRASTVSNGSRERIVLLLGKLKKPLFMGTTPKLHYPGFSLFLYNNK